MLRIRVFHRNITFINYHLAVGVSFGTRKSGDLSRVSSRFSRMRIGSPKFLRSKLVYERMCDRSTFQLARPKVGGDVCTTASHSTEDLAGTVDHNDRSPRPESALIVVGGDPQCVKKCARNRSQRHLR